MSFLNVKNRAKSTLASGISDTDTSLTVATGEGAKFPEENFIATLEKVDDPTYYERVLCTSRTDDVLTVIRGYDGTTAKSFPAGTIIELRVTAKVIEQLQNASPEKILTTQGDILIRGATGIERLPAGEPGQVLKTQGAGANPVWDDIPLKINTIFVGSVVDLSADIYHYASLNGYQHDTSPSKVECPFPVSGTLKNLYIRVPQNTLSGGADVKIYKNGGSTSLSISLSSGQTGTFSNTTDTVSIAAGDRICIRADGYRSASGQITIIWAVVFSE